MQNQLERQLSGSVPEVMERLVDALRQQGLEVLQGDAEDEADLRMVTATDPDAVADAARSDPDAAAVGTASISVRRTGDGARITLLDPTAKAALTEEADLLDPGQRLRDAITRALDALGSAADGEDGEEGQGSEESRSRAGDPEVRDALLDAIRQTTTSIGDMDTRDRAEVLFTLAKAYTAIASLDRTEEVELHLA